jgi:uncharacterized delta-60 repeat protein
MATANTASGDAARTTGAREVCRPPVARRRGSRRLWPIAEGLEARTLLSAGLDPTWGSGGVSAMIARPDASTAPDAGAYQSIAMQDGQVVAVGSLLSGTAGNLAVTRFNPDGSIDTSFGTKGTEIIPLTDGSGTYQVESPADIAVQSDGDIDILATAMPTGSSVNEFLVVQLNPNGPIDTTFGTSGFAWIDFGSNPSSYGSRAEFMAIAPDGKIVAVGESSGGSAAFTIARLNTDGTLDTSFDGTGMATITILPGGGSNDIYEVGGVVVEPDDSVVVAGSVIVPSNNSELSEGFVARLTPAGTLDPSFNGHGELTYRYDPGGGLAESLEAVTLDGTDIVIVGAYGYDLTVAMLNGDGSFDTSFNGNGQYLMSFNPAGIPFESGATAVVARPDGSLLIGGFVGEIINNPPGSGPTFGLLLSMTPTGVPDATFGTDGEALTPNEVGSRLVLESDGEVLFLALGGSPQSDGQIVYAMGPAPAVVSASMITAGAAGKAQARGVTIKFNTAINPLTASEVKVYRLNRLGKPKKAIKGVKVSYHAATSTLTLKFARTPASKGLQVVIAPGEIVGDDGELPYGDPVLPIVIDPRR